MTTRLKAVLLDLDNTLIIFNESLFYTGYLKRIGKVFADLVPSEQFPDQLMTATMALLDNDGAKTNVEFFMDILTGLCGGPRGKLWQRFLQFYETEYDRLPRKTALPAGLEEVFIYFAQTGYKLVLASNPIFPLNAQHKRLAWAGLQDIRFDLMTHIENMSYCKPNLGYYHEICEMIEEPPEACLMVGNDSVNDMVASRIGMTTYLTTDDKDLGQGDLHVSAGLRDHATLDVPTPDFAGPLKGVIKVVENLQKGV